MARIVLTSTTNRKSRPEVATVSLDGSNANGEMVARKATDNPAGHGVVAKEKAKAKAKEKEKANNVPPLRNGSLPFGEPLPQAKKASRHVEIFCKGNALKEKVATTGIQINAKLFKKGIANSETSVRFSMLRSSWQHALRRRNRMPMPRPRPNRRKRKRKRHRQMQRKANLTKIMIMIGVMR